MFCFETFCLPMIVLGQRKIKNSSNFSAKVIFLISNLALESESGENFLRFVWKLCEFSVFSLLDDILDIQSKT